MILLIWAVVAVIMFALCSYSIGCDAAETTDDVGGLFFVSFAISLLWPFFLALLIITGPFYLLYKLGKRKTRIETEKKQVWATLKN